MFRFADPIYFVLLVPFILAWIMRKKREEYGILFSAPFWTVSHIRTWRIVFLQISEIALFGGLCLAILALAKPQKFFIKSDVLKESIAIEMVLDVSGSMALADISNPKDTNALVQTRLDSAKTSFSEFIKRRENDFVGIITFGGYATTVCPLTFDHRAVLEIVRQVQIHRAIFGESGLILNRDELLTAIGDAIMTAIARLKNAPQKTKIIVLLTDGESNTGLVRPEDAAKVALREGIRIYTIGVAPSTTSKNDDANAEGHDAFLLSQIAETTRGRYFSASDIRGLESAMREIDAMEKTIVETHNFELVKELFPWFLAPAIVMIASAFAMRIILYGRVV